MHRTKVTSIRLDAGLLEKATAFGLNISKVCETALENEVSKAILNESIVIPEGIVGLIKGSRIIMAERKFKEIEKVRAGDRVLSRNESTDRLEETNVIDVGPLTSEKAFAAFVTIENAGGTQIELLPDTKIFCWRNSFSDACWLPAKDIRPSFLVSTVSHKGSPGSTYITKVKENHIHSIFYRLELYPSNNFFANSNPRRKLHYVDDYMSSIWTFPIKGRLGQISSLLERSNMSK